MNPIDVTMSVMEAAERINNPIEYWKKHCVNCGVLAGDTHIRDDCPPQHYEEQLKDKE